MTGATPVDDADLVAFADDLLGEPRRTEVATWLARHPGDASRIAAWRRQPALLHAALAPVATELVPAPLNAVLNRRRPRWLLPAAAAAALIFALGLGTGRLVFGGAGPLQAVTLAENGADAYRVYVSEVRHPVEVGADEEAHLIAWLTKRLDFPVRVPDLSSLGLHLVGGRLLPAGGEPAAMLMYEGTAGDRYTLFIARSTDGATTAFRYIDDAEIGSFYWIDGSVGYVLTGPDQRTELLRIATAVYDQIS